MTNQFTHIADIKVGMVKGDSRTYPQLRLASQYAELAGKKASIYEISGHERGPAFIIRFDSQNNVAAYHGDGATISPMRSTSPPHLRTHGRGQFLQKNG